MRKQDKRWKILVKLLKKHYPISLPLSIRRRKFNGDCGYTSFNGAKIIIEINANHGYVTQEETLLHEYAHAMVIDEAYCHKGRWGVFYGEIFDSWGKWELEN